MADVKSESADAPAPSPVMAVSQDNADGAHSSSKPEPLAGTSSGATPPADSPGVSFAAGSEIPESGESPGGGVESVADSEKTVGTTLSVG